MNPTAIKILGIITAVAPIVYEVLSALPADQPVNWTLVLTAIVSAIGGSQVAKRFGDKTPQQVEQLIARASVPPVVNVSMPAALAPTAEDGMRIRDALAQAQRVYGPPKE